MASLNRAALAAERVALEVKDYPATLQSRLALDALADALKG